MHRKSLGSRFIDPNPEVHSHEFFFEIQPSFQSRFCFGTSVRKSPPKSPTADARSPDSMRTEAEEACSAPAARGHYDPNQPRVPAGDPKADGGWTRATATSRLCSKRAVHFHGRFRKGIESRVGRISRALSARNTPDRRAIIEFNARGYRTDESGELNRANVEVLNRNQVREACPRLEEVQSRTDGAAETVRRGGGIMSPQQYGTAVHTNLKRQIDSLKDPNFRAEVSRLKSETEEVRHGRRGSIRVDVLENAGGGTVCVYDIKTGTSGLSPARMAEIVGDTFKHFPNTKRIIISEIRPKR